MLLNMWDDLYTSLEISSMLGKDSMSNDERKDMGRPKPNLQLFIDIF